MAFKLRNPFAAKTADKATPEIMDRAGDGEGGADYSTEKLDSATSGLKDTLKTQVRTAGDGPEDGRISTNMTIERQTPVEVGGDAREHVVQYNESDLAFGQAGTSGVTVQDFETNPETGGDTLRTVPKTSSNIQNNRTESGGESPDADSDASEMKTGTVKFFNDTKGFGRETATPGDADAPESGPVRLDPTPARVATGDEGNAPPEAAINTSHSNIKNMVAEQDSEAGGGAGEPAGIAIGDPGVNGNIAPQETLATVTNEGRDRLRIVPTAQTTGRETVGDGSAPGEPAGIAIGEPGSNTEVTPAGNAAIAHEAAHVVQQRDPAAGVPTGGAATLDDGGVAASIDGGPRQTVAADGQKNWLPSNFRGEGVDDDDDDGPSTLLDLSSVSGGQGAVAIAGLDGDAAAGLADLDSDADAIDLDDVMVDS